MAQHTSRHTRTMPKQSTILSRSGPSTDRLLTLAYSSDAAKPLLTLRKRRAHSSLISQIRKSVAPEEMTPLEMNELASHDLRIGMEEIDDQDTLNLLSSIRSLPNSMAEKRHYREELLKASEGLEKGTLNFPIEAFCKRVKRSFLETTKTLQQHFTLWSSSFKAIEGRHGTGVVSYFVFLRWLLLMNSILFIGMFVFVVLPQVIGTRVIRTNNTTKPVTDVFSSHLLDRFPDKSPALDTLNFYSSESVDPLRSHSKSVQDLGALLDIYGTEGIHDEALFHTPTNQSRETVLVDFCSDKYQLWLAGHEYTISSSVQGFFEGSGWMENTTLLIGFYTSAVKLFRDGKYYNMSVAVLATVLILLIVNIIMMMMYASEGVQEAMMDRLQETYCCTAFCGWNFCIEEAKAADQQHNSIYQEILSMLAEERRKAKKMGWTPSYQARIYVIRAGAYVATILMLIATYYLMFFVAKIQLRAEVRKTGYWFGMLMKFLPSITFTFLNFVFPLALEIITRFEEYQIERQINQLLLRIILMREASLIILVSSFYNLITCEPKDQCSKGYDACPSPLCWETYVGQQMYRLVLMDFFSTVGVTLIWETPRMYILKRWKNKCTKLLGVPQFDIPLQVLSLVYTQTVTWLGMLYCPLLPAVTVVKIIVFFYIKKFTVLTNYNPAKTAYKASRSNAIFVIVLMLSFFISTGILGYSVTRIDTSVGCSPFRYHHHMQHTLGQAITEESPELYGVFNFALSPIVAIPTVIMLCLLLYYYITKIWAHKKMVQLLRVQLAMEGKDKQFLLMRLTKL